MIYLRKCTNIHIEIICTDNQTLREIKAHFSYPVITYKDKKRKIVNVCLLYRDRYLPFGLINDMIEFLDDNNIHFNVDHEIFETNTVDIDKLYKSFDYYKLPHIPTEYQKKTVYLCMRDKRKIVLSPTSSGKSLIIFLTCMSYLIMKEPNKKIIIVVPSITLVNQMYYDFKDYTKNSSIDISDYVQRKGGGNKEEFTKNILITTWQSLMNEKYTFLNQFGMLLFDEVHTGKAPVTKDIVEKINAPYRIGFTGTLTNEDDELSGKTIQGLFGDVHVATNYAELLDLEFITPLEIRSIILNHTGVDYKLTWHEEREFITTSNPRFLFVTNLIKKCKGNSLVLFKTIDHGKKLAHELEKTKTVFYIDGGIKGQMREDIRQEMERDDNCVLVASYKTTATGFSVKNIHNVIFAESMKARISVIQAIGRGLRKHNTKDIVLIYDICDSILYDNFMISYSEKHYQSRKRYYNEYDYPFREVEVNI